MASLLARRPAADRTFERLYRNHAGDVYRYALALLRDPAEAEDATQTAFLNAYRALVRGEEPHAPKAWLLAIVHNVCRMRRRSLARRPREVPLDDHPLAAPDDERPRLDDVLAALAELPLNQRAALVMREVEGRSYHEIAEALGVTTSAVEALIFRARRRLRVRREALGAIAAAPVPASLGVSSGGVAATVLGTDVALKAAAGLVAALLAGGAAYKATTSGHGATASGRRQAPVVRRLLAASETSARRPAKRHRASAPTRTAPATHHRATTVTVAVLSARRAAHHRALRERTAVAKGRVLAPVSTSSAPSPTTQPQRRRLSPVLPTRRGSRQRHPLKRVVHAAQGAVQVPTTTVQAPQLPPVSAPTPPPVPDPPSPPPLPKIP